MLNSACIGRVGARDSERIVLDVLKRRDACVGFKYQSCLFCERMLNVAHCNRVNTNS